MRFQKMYDAGVEMAFMANESYDKIQGLKELVEVKMLAQLDAHDRRVETCNTLGLPFEVEDYNSVADHEFYLSAAMLEAEKARFNSLCESAGKTLTAAFTYEDIPGSFPTDKILAT